MPAAWLTEFQRGCQGLGLQHRMIHVGADDWTQQLGAVDLFVWRLIMGDPSIMAEARTKIPLIEAMGIPSFPNTLMLWLFDDKIRETFFLRTHGYPTPRTWVFFDERDARGFIQQARYPLVAKTHTGAGAGGVMLVRSQSQAQALLRGVFRPQSVWDKVAVKYFYMPRLSRGDFLLERRFRYRDHCPRYLYLQEFVETPHDWRITTLGPDLVSVFVRRNRPNDFRASGSGLWDMVSESDLPVDACDLALAISNRHGLTSMTYDFMCSEAGWVIGEMSYSFVLNSVYENTVFRRVGSSYQKMEPTPIGTAHLQALLAAPRLTQGLTRLVLSAPPTKPHAEAASFAQAAGMGESASGGGTR